MQIMKELTNMGLFFKDIENQSTKDVIQSSDIDYNEVLDYLTGLTDEDYEKLIKVANIYRRANRQVLDVLNPTNTEAPEIAENGEPGEERILTLELKLMADVGLVGFPSVGKPKQDGENSEADEIIDSFLETDEAEAKGDTNNG